MICSIMSCHWMPLDNPLTDAVLAIENLGSKPASH